MGLTQQGHDMYEATIIYQRNCISTSVHRVKANEESVRIFLTAMGTWEKNAIKKISWRKIW